MFRWLSWEIITSLPSPGAREGSVNAASPHMTAVVAVGRGERLRVQGKEMQLPHP